VRWFGKRVLTTGAGGFIGSHLVERLASEGAKVRALVHYNGRGDRGWLAQSPIERELDVVVGDVSDSESVLSAMEGVDVVFHLAALIAIPYSYAAPRSYARTNVEGTLNILQAARQVGVSRVVHTSTSEVYGSAATIPMTEDHPRRAQSPYAASKVAADAFVEAYHRSFAVPAVVVRPFNAFGPRQSARAVIPSIIAQALTRPEIELGALEPTRDFNYVADLVEGFLLAGSTQGVDGETIHFGTGVETSIGDVVRKVGEILERPVKVHEDSQRRRPPASEVDRLCADAGKAHRLLGWTPATDFDVGLENTVRWVEEHIEQYRPDSFAV
jgi:dTDP-glucose 4,6-dehydratase